MTRVVATLRVVTPMFLGGAEPKSAPAELRASSLKGALRFWWRACAWARFDDIEALRREELYVFGGPGGAGHIGQSRVMVRIDQPGPAPTQNFKPAQNSGARYLGYGPIDGSSIRSHLPQGTDLTVRLTLRSLADQQRDLVVDALRGLCTFGGLGSRSRRGYGSVSLTSLKIGEDDVPVASSREDTIASIRLLAGYSQRPGLPEFTALSAGSRFSVGRSTGDPIYLLDKFGVAYKEYRKLTDDETGARAVKRAAFGLPANVGRDKTVVKPRGHERRASPLFVHLHDCGGGRALPVVSFLPARFLPDPRLSIGTRTVGLPPENDLYQPVTDFLDTLPDYEWVVV